jgi:membrane-bound serine protease (ClpP class)
MKRRSSLHWLALAWIFGGLLAAIALAGSPARATAPASRPVIELITVDGVINPASADFITDSIARAERDRAAALVIELDTPGGLLTSARTIVKALLNSPVPVIVYVAPAGASAASAGTFMTEAANIAAMAPGTTIGAAHPVELGGGDVEGAMGAKLENFTVSFAKTIAHQRGRNEAWVEDAVRKSSAIGENEALKLHVIDIVASDLPSLLSQASGRSVKVAGKVAGNVSGGQTIKLELANAIVRRGEMRLGGRIMNRLADPNLMYLLMIAGILGLYFEFAHPGVFLPGVAGAICLLLALASFEVIPINVAGLLLMILGVGLLISELFVTSYGVVGMGGVAAFVIGSFLLIDSSETNLEINRGIIWGAAAAMSAIILGVGYIAIHAGRGRARTGREGLIGEVGVVREAIAPGRPGRMFVHGELWRAASGASLEPGAQARVASVHGLELFVETLAEARCAPERAQGAAESARRGENKKSASCVKNPE